MDPLNSAPGAGGPPPQVWPPPPTNSPFAGEPSPLSAVESFRVQNYWLVFFLMVVTLEIYAVFWLKRQIVVINSLRPNLKQSLIYANIVLGVAFVSAGLDVASWVSSNQTLDAVTTGLDRVFGIMLLVLLLQVRNGFNMTLRLQGGSPYWFGGIFTWLFGAAYLQYKINRNIQIWREDPRRAAGPVPM